MFHIPSAVFSLRGSSWSTLLSTHRATNFPFTCCKLLSTTGPSRSNNVEVAHARFLAESGASSKWKNDDGQTTMGGLDGPADTLEGLGKGRGKLSPTSSHLFMLILPLGEINLKLRNSRGNEHKRDHHVTKLPPPTVFLLHPSQPLTHVSKLIVSSFSPARPKVSFRSSATDGHHMQWSEATDIGDFIRSAARATEFDIHITFPVHKYSGDSDEKDDTESLLDETVITVEVPTFADRTRFLRRRLEVITKELKDMEGLKKECDHEAHRGARRMAVGGFGLLVVYWGGVARLTFWDYGWDVMEPITYLSGLSSVICGYLWFLYQGREVSYSSVLDRSISARREALYKARGLDIDHWGDLVAEARVLRRDIGRIAQDYDHDLGRGGENNRESQGDEQVGEGVQLDRVNEPKNDGDEVTGRTRR